MRAIRSPGRRARQAAGAAVMCALAVGCATGGVASRNANEWREDMGRVTRVTLEAGLDRVVRKHALEIQRTQDSSREIYYETRWSERDLMADEEVRGVTHARNRIVIVGHRLESTMAGAGVYRITWSLENEVTAVGIEGWHPDVVPEQVIEDYRTIYSDLMLEIRTGLIR